MGKSLAATHIHCMTKRERWTERLRCPICNVTGSVELSQAASTSQAYHDGTDQNVCVEIVPAEFKVAVTDLGCEFYCASCGALADHIRP